MLGSNMGMQIGGMRMSYGNNMGMFNIIMGSGMFNIIMGIGMYSGNNMGMFL